MRFGVLCRFCVERNVIERLTKNTYPTKLPTKTLQTWNSRSGIYIAESVKDFLDHFVAESVKDFLDVLETLDEFRYLPTHHEERSRDKRKKYFQKISKIREPFLG